MHLPWSNRISRSLPRPESRERREAMTPKTFVGQFLSLGLVLTITGVASARRPASLVNLQEETGRVVATCPSAPSTSGYRDMLTRFDRNPAASSVTARVARQTTHGHLVLKCAGGDVHEGGGYRDMLVRFFHDSAEPQMARIDRRQVR